MHIHTSKPSCKIVTNPRDIMLECHTEHTITTPYEPEQFAPPNPYPCLQESLAKVETWCIITRERVAEERLQNTWAAKDEPSF